jgi:hypothetical protein
MKDDSGILVLIVAILVALVLSAYFGIQEAQKWNQFKQEHNCQVVSKISGSTSTGLAPVIGGNGGVAMVSTYTPGKTGWLCDDGVTYYR